MQQSHFSSHPMHGLSDQELSVHAQMFISSPVSNLAFLEYAIRCCASPDANVSKERRDMCQNVLVFFRNDLNSCTLVPTLVEGTNNTECYFFALQVLEAAINSRWKSFEPSFQVDMRNYVINMVVYVCTACACAENDYSLPPEQYAFLQKISLSLLAIVRLDWPYTWPTFVADVIGILSCNPRSLEFTLYIFKILAEEIYAFTNNLTQTKVASLQSFFVNDFGMIFCLIATVLYMYPLRFGQHNNLNNFEVLSSLYRDFGYEQNQLVAGFFNLAPEKISDSFAKFTVGIWGGFINWAPRNLVFNPLIIDLLVNFYSLRTDNLELVRQTFDVYLEIGCAYYKRFRSDADGYAVLMELFSKITNIIKVHIFKSDNPETSVSKFYAPSGINYNVLFVLLKCVTTYLKCMLDNVYIVLTSSSNINNLPDYPTFAENVIYSIKLLIALSNIEEDTYGEFFSTCIIFWENFSYLLKNFLSNNNLTSMRNLKMYNNNLKQVLTSLIKCIVKNMAKPEEVLVVISEGGDIDREFLTDTDSINVYNRCCRTLKSLAEIDISTAHSLMQDMLRGQRNDAHWNYRKTSTLCWSVGAIANIADYGVETEFVSSILRSLLSMCENKNSKSDRAVVATNIMYVIRCHQRFLQNHWTFLHVVTEKLFDFMHEEHEGIKDMACDTFLVIAKACAKEFVVTHIDQHTYNRNLYDDIISNSGSSVYLEEIIDKIGDITRDLELHQKVEFFRALGFIIGLSTKHVNTEDGYVRNLLNYCDWNAVATDKEEGFGEAAVDYILPREYTLSSYQERTFTRLLSIIKVYVALLQTPASSAVVRYIVNNVNNSNVMRNILMLYEGCCKRLEFFFGQTSQDSANRLVTQYVTVKKIVSLKREMILFLTACYGGSFVFMIKDGKNEDAEDSDDEDADDYREDKKENTTNNKLEQIFETEEPQEAATDETKNSQLKDRIFARNNHLPSSSINLFDRSNREQVVGIVVNDYLLTGSAELRSYEVLYLLAAIVQNMQNAREVDQENKAFAVTTLTAVFSVTFPMICQDMVEYPDHRKGFFYFIWQVVSNCGHEILSTYSESDFSMFIETTLFGMQHLIPDVSILSLNIFRYLMSQLTGGNYVQMQELFYREFFFEMMNKFLFYLFDALYVFGRYEACDILSEVLHYVESGAVRVPLGKNPVNGELAASNVFQFREFIGMNMSRMYPHMTEKQLLVFLDGIFLLKGRTSEMVRHVKDFMVQGKQLSADQGDELFLDQRIEELNQQAGGANGAAPFQG